MTPWLQKDPVLKLDSRWPQILSVTYGYNIHGEHTVEGSFTIVPHTTTYHRSRARVKVPSSRHRGSKPNERWWDNWDQRTSAHPSTPNDLEANGRRKLFSADVPSVCKDTPRPNGLLISSPSTFLVKTHRENVGIRSIAPLASHERENPAKSVSIYPLP